ncbi:LysR family transcriptional regulator [Gilvimarinus sp. DA14]|uniref:LysR family transcriptional regulator n=1 Tax=Gilvimarinus sp. DA14 TaxID=2956798 RepID=UPI0020B8DC12|nr:LysR family transcriptional regulator [Gilvimarinus sp. DA14]UTF59466.1 LysR family transcriptional regulator [Gilvimarinus sp. DA14]
MNYRWLHTFITLVEEGTFTQTAQKLHMTQPGVSQHIAKLEQSLGVSLLAREGKRFELTEPGRRLADYAVRVFQQEQHLLQTLADDSPYQGECRIGCSGSLALLLYPVFLQRQCDHRELMVSLEAAPNERLINMVDKGELDVAVVSIAKPKGELEYTAIGHQNLCLVVPKTFAVKHKGLPDWAALQQLGFIDHPDAASYMNQVLALAYGKQFTGLQALSKRSYVNQINQILTPVAQGLGFTVLPQATIDSSPHIKKITSVPLPKAVVEPLYLIKRREFRKPSRYEWFELQIRSEVNRLARA